MEDEIKNIAPEGARTYLRDNPTAPVRILVSTATHLVPGDEYFTKTDFMRNLVCQHHWDHDFEWDHDRFTAYNAEFGYDNVACYFLIDHGQSSNATKDGVPILWYRWTGKSLVPIRESLPSRIRKRLKKIPFTPPQSAPSKEPCQLDDTERRKDIWAKLRRNMRPSDSDFTFLREHPEHATWLERNMEPRFWTKLKSLEIERLEFQDKVARGIIRIIKNPPKQEKEKKPKEFTGECTGMWDCECPVCDS
ncbi:hypothetical protein F5Y10DRAFT_24338 [Nemania abortiva]|nr:hypothetical protein F5Y10DRAFT_24338 [Nemania abortiva]